MNSLKRNDSMKKLTNCEIEDLLNGKHTKFPVHRLKDKLIRSGMKKAECEICGYKERRITDGKIPLLLNATAMKASYQQCRSAIYEAVSSVTIF